MCSGQPHRRRCFRSLSCVFRFRACGFGSVVAQAGIRSRSKKHWREVPRGEENMYMDGAEWDIAFTDRWRSRLRPHPLPEAAPHVFQTGCPANCYRSRPTCRNWVRENFDHMRLEDHQRINHFRNNYELTRKDHMVSSHPRHWPHPASVPLHMD